MSSKSTWGIDNTLHTYFKKQSEGLLKYKVILVCSINYGRTYPYHIVVRLLLPPARCELRYFRAMTEPWYSADRYRIHALVVEGCSFDCYTHTGQDDQKRKTWLLDTKQCHQRRSHVCRFRGEESDRSKDQFDMVSTF